VKLCVCYAVTALVAVVCTRRRPTCLTSYSTIENLMFCSVVATSSPLDPQPSRRRSVHCSACSASKHKQRHQLTLIWFGVTARLVPLSVRLRVCLSVPCGFLTGKMSRWKTKLGVNVSRGTSNRCAISQKKFTPINDLFGERCFFSDNLTEI